MKFGIRLKELREEKGLSQEAFGKIIVKSRSSVAGYEVNDRMPDSETLLLIADHFDCSLDYLFGRSDYRKHSDEAFNNIIAEKTNIPDEFLGSVINLIERFLELIKASTIYPLPANPPLYYECPQSLYFELEKCILALYGYLQLNLIDMHLQLELKRAKTLADTDFIEKQIKDNTREINKNYGFISTTAANYILEVKDQCEDLLKSEEYSTATETENLIQLIPMYLNLPK